MTGYMNYPMTDGYDGRPKLLKQLADALDGESSRNVITLYRTLAQHGYESIEDVKCCDIAEAYGWNGIGEHMCGLLKRLGAKGDTPHPERKPPEERRKLVCPLCGSAMSPGGRVNIAMGFEMGDSTNYNRRSRSVIVCRSCGEELAGKCGVEVPS